MARVTYPAILERQADGFGVYLHDLPVNAVGATEAEAFAAATEALELYLETAAEEGWPVPAPSALAEAEVLDRKSFVSRILVGAARHGRAQKVTISLDEGLLERIDNAVKASHVQGGRSGFLAEGARTLLRDAASGSARGQKKRHKIARRKLAPIRGGRA
ncbi:MAG: type II toxin-antitoxin system HicB family antitoxin [Kiloniellales bacterium]